LNTAIEELSPKSSGVEFSFAQLMALLGSKFNWDPISGPSVTKGGLGTFDENGWAREEGDYAPVVVDLEESDDQGNMDVDVDFNERMKASGRMDMTTGRMVFQT
jgi:hypothetical protein